MIDFKQLTKPYEESAVKSLQRLVQSNSVYDESTVSNEHPYGLGVHESLTIVHNMAKKDGFKVEYIDGRVTEITFGEGEREIGIFAHADVVPATGTWDYPPFSGTIRDGYMYSRGVSDDKGPLIAAYYAIKALKEAGLINGYKVRMVVGGDEERGSSCMHYYFNILKKAPVTYGFTPDAEFPLIYGEKGITNYISTKEINLNPLISLSGGKASNSVIDELNMVISKDDSFMETLKEMKLKFTYKNVGNEAHITVFGKSAHGSMPELGFNAGLAALEALGSHYSLGFLSNIAESYKDTKGRNLDAYYYSDLLGESSYNIGLMNYKNGVLEFTTNFRHPENVDISTHLNNVAAMTDMEVSAKSSSLPLLFDPKSPFIQKLLNVYQLETGDLDSKPMAIGGGTYAKECPNTVAFGSAFKGRDGSIHQANEYVLLTDIYAQMHIYAHAIYALGLEL
ncbi:MAG TPA: Sapep family Mn(2+)-dependent dipeptidase [Bacilli bacterium]|nr:Sapep family Mn(2+)-dependent dipeptidase [Bacilli bacterium]